MTTTERTCEGCGKTFAPRSSNQQYCTPECCRRTHNLRRAQTYFEAVKDGVPSYDAVRKGRARSAGRGWAKDAPKLTQEERDERCIAFLQRRAKNVPCCECRCRVLEGEWTGPSGDNPSGKSIHDVHVRVWCDKGLEPSVGCPGFMVGYPQRRVRCGRRKAKGSKRREEMMEADSHCDLERP